MIHLKRGTQFQATGLRTILLRHQERTAYALHVIHWTAGLPDLMNGDEQIMMSLSQRFEDQVEDAVAVGFDAQVEQQHIFGTFVLSSDLATSGGGVVVGNHTIAFPIVPYLVPYASWILNSAVAGIGRASVELFFERVRVSNFELAQLVAAAGGRTESAPS